MLSVKDLVRDKPQEYQKIVAAAKRYAKLTNQRNASGASGSGSGPVSAVEMDERAMLADDSDSDSTSNE